MKKKPNHISLFYWIGDSSSRFTDERKVFLKFLEHDVRLKGLAKKAIVDFHSHSGLSDGHVSIFDNKNSFEAFYSAVDFVLSKSEGYFPISVLGRKKTEFDVVESVLKTHYGDRVKLSYGFCNIGKLLNQAKIKYNKSSKALKS